MLTSDQFVASFSALVIREHQNEHCMVIMCSATADWEESVPRKDCINSSVTSLPVCLAKQIKTSEIQNLVNASTEVVPHATHASRQLTHLFSFEFFNSGVGV